MHPRRAGWLRASAAALTVLIVGGCSAISGLSDLTFDSDAGAGCNSNADCATDDACKVGTCADHRCVIKDLADEPSFDDHNPCTTDTCKDGEPVHTPLADGAACKDQGHEGTCEHTECRVPCGGGCLTNDKCAVGKCDAKTNLCTFTLLDGVPVPGEPQTVGDCAELDCVHGVTTKVEDAKDLPKVTDCYKATCDAGPGGKLVPGKSPKPVHSACSTGGSFCDGDGKCVDCIDDVDCPDDGDPCDEAICSSQGKCSDPHRPAGPSSTLAAEQTDGDCHRVQCDGSGNTVTVVDTSDAGNGDGNPCHDHTCDMAGNHVETNKMDGTACGNGLSCVGGTCSGCTSVGQCPSNPDEACMSGACVCPGSGLQLQTCASAGRTCGTIPNTGCGATLNCNDFMVDGSETDVDCGGNGCPNCAQGKKCNVGSDCTTGFCADGVCCASACTGGCNACSLALNGVANGICRPIPSGDPAKSGCAPNPPCGNTGRCDGSGACAKTPAPTPCGSTCSMGVQTNETCDGTGSCVNSASLGCSPYVCNGSVCGTTCANDGQCVNGDHCSGGMCVNQKSNGQSCATNTECSSNHCVDGVCCNTACNATCMACNLGGNVGTCTAVAVDSPDPGSCDNSHGTCSTLCSGCGPQCECGTGGMCLVADGAPCACNANCAGGTCIGSNNCTGAANGSCAF